MFLTKLVIADALSQIVLKNIDMSFTSSSRQSTHYTEIASYATDISSLGKIKGLENRDEQIYKVPCVRYIELETGREHVFIERIFLIYYTADILDFMSPALTRFEVMKTHDEKLRDRFFLSRKDSSPRFEEEIDEIEAKLVSLYGLPVAPVEEEEKDTKLPVEEPIVTLISILTASMRSVGGRLEMLESTVLRLQEEVRELRQKKSG